MTTSPRRVIPLREFIPALLARDALSDDQGTMLWHSYRAQVHVEFPSPKTDGRWQLTSQGWVGQIPLDDGVVLTLEPKVDVGNLFRMLEYAYQLRSFRFLDGLIGSQSLADVYDRLAAILARRILDWARKGFYRAYLARTDRLPYVRGRIDVPAIVRRPDAVDLTCHYHDCTADVEENRILAWTLFVVARTGLCRGSTLTHIRRAFHALQGLVTLQPYTARACIGRTYNRLNDDYRSLHALCRFFLDHSGPTHRAGDRSMIPFMVDMARLYERFVAEWLKMHLPPSVELSAQENHTIDADRSLHFTIDLVLRDPTTGRSLCVLDTKYKDEHTPSADDIAQVVAYAAAKGCRDALLIYPIDVPPLDRYVGDIRVRATSFSLSGDVDEAGHRFLRSVWRP
jgi:5-methylcytosine-specific restriction enzyme subunit McrC